MTLLVAALLVLSPQEFPRLAGPVTDAAGELSPAQVREAEQVSRALEQSDSTQIALLVVRTTGGRDIAEYALEVARRHGIGQGGKNNGALIVVAVDDRRVRIDVGTGLEGRLPDALCSRIIRDEMVPSFRKGDYGAGALAGMRAVAAAVKGEYKGNPKSDRISKIKAAGLLLMVIVIVVVIMAMSKGGGSGLGWFATGYVLGGLSGGGGSSWGGGGGSSWSGGGGSFGGGGASGSW